MRSPWSLLLFSVLLLVPRALHSQPSATFVVLLHGSVHGTVVDRMSQEPLDDARITLVSSAIQDTTAHTGRFGIQLVPAGTYNVLVQCKGYFSLKTRLRIEPDRDKAVVFRLMSFKDANEPRRASDSRPQLHG